MTGTRLPEALVSDALVVWSGKGRTRLPARDERLVVDAFGDGLALSLVPLIRRLVDDFYSSDALLWASGLAEMGHAAAAQFRSRHAEISEDALDALTWCYMYDSM